MSALDLTLLFRRGGARGGGLPQLEAAAHAGYLAVGVLNRPGFPPTQRWSAWSPKGCVSREDGPSTVTHRHESPEGVSTLPPACPAGVGREVRELRKANEILKLASAFFAQAELDRRIKSRRPRRPASPAVRGRDLSRHADRPRRRNWRHAACWHNLGALNAARSAMEGALVQRVASQLPGLRADLAPAQPRRRGGRYRCPLSG